MIAVDWGTSSFRAYRLDAAGQILERRVAEVGIARVHDEAFADELERQVGDWLAGDPGPTLMSGMIGSRNGWLEVPYVPCPAGAEEIGAGLREVRWGKRRAWIAPGLSCHDSSGVPDVMRGEETQLVGVLDTLPPDATICLPGTHSKWATIRNRRITSFATALTGELYGCLRDHTILRHAMTGGPVDRASFDEGLARARTTGGLLHHLFGVRARMLLGELRPAEIGGYLSGIVIGHEIDAVELRPSVVWLLGSAELTSLYRRALESSGHTAHLLDPDAAAYGLFRLAPRVGT